METVEELIKTLKKMQDEIDALKAGDGENTRLKRLEAEVSGLRKLIVRLSKKAKTPEGISIADWLKQEQGGL